MPLDILALHDIGEIVMAKLSLIVLARCEHVCKGWKIIAAKKGNYSLVTLCKALADRPCSDILKRLRGCGDNARLCAARAFVARHACEPRHEFVGWLQLCSQEHSGWLCDEARRVLLKFTPKIGWVDYGRVRWSVVRQKELQVAPVNLIKVSKEVLCPIYSMALSPCSTRVAIGGHGAYVVCMDTGRTIFELGKKLSPVRCIAWCPSGRYIATGCSLAKCPLGDLPAPCRTYVYCLARQKMACQVMSLTTRPDQKSGTLSTGKSSSFPFLLIR